MGSTPDAGDVLPRLEGTIKFLGSFTYQLDGKGRVSLPAAFRREVPEGQRYVLVQAYAPALALYPEGEWVEVEERLQDLVGRRPEARMYVLSVMSKAVEVSPDGQGRILIPSSLRSAAELDGEALLVGAINKIEIWNPAQFEDAVREEAAAFAEFAPQIFR